MKTGSVRVFCVLTSVASVCIASGMAASRGSRAQPVNAIENLAASTIGDVARLVMEAPQIVESAFSPNGKMVLYTVKRASATRNEVVSELMMQDVGQHGGVNSAPIRLDRAVLPREEYSFVGRWCPDGTCITYMQPSSDEGRGALVRYDLRIRRAMRVPIRDVDAPGVRPRVVAVGADYQWAPSGKVIAFTASLGKTAYVTPRGGVPVTAQILQKELSFATGPKRGLFLLDSETGELEQLSSERLDVRRFGWAPDGRALAVEVVSEDDEQISDDRSDVWIIDRSTGAERPLLRQPGYDGNPFWSPNGEWIALQTAGGALGGDVVLAVVPVAGGPIVRLASDDVDEVSPVGGKLFWSPDSRTFYYSIRYHMTQRLLRADIATGHVTSVAVDDDASLFGVSVTPDCQWLMFSRSTLTAPPELYVQSLANGQQRQLTALSPDFSLTKRVNIERVQWPSRDNLFTVHGLLLTPMRFGASHSQKNKIAFPTLVYVYGGPGMVSMEYESRNVELLSLAAQGYAILIPNTRGRSGYGTDFRTAIRNGASFAKLPYEDLIAGVDYLVERGIADPSRLGIWGHSYGGYLTSYAVTQTHRFRAAVDYDGAAAQLVGLTMERLPATGGDRLFVTGLGVQNPFAPSDMVRLIAESPAFNMHCARTPMLLLFSEHGEAKRTSGGVLFSALQRFGVPVEFVLYDEGHEFSSPLAKLDYVGRMSAWFDYWVRDRPYSDTVLQKKYDEWRVANASSRSLSITQCVSSAKSPL